jgi:hypothetical protein
LDSNASLPPQPESPPSVSASSEASTLWLLRLVKACAGKMGARGRGRGGGGVGYGMNAELKNAAGECVSECTLRE